jgi:hypothetical protein
MVDGRDAGSAMKALSQDLIWPAAAGNVAWAFFTVLLNERLTDANVWARLAALFLLAIYLAGEWLRNRKLTQVKAWYWIADAAHVTSIVVFAIATHLNKDWLECALLAVFLIAAAGQVTGAWDDPVTGNLTKRWALGGANMLGAAVLYGSYALPVCPYPWNLPAARVVALTAWFCVQRKFSQDGSWI